MAEKRKILDVDEVQAALDRAAWNARYGTAEVRAGRFVPRDGGSGEGDARGAEERARVEERGKK